MIIIIITTIMIKTNTCTTLLTVAHEGTTTVNTCACPKRRDYKKFTGRVGPMKILIFTKSTRTNKIHGIIFPPKNARTPGTKSSTKRYEKNYCRIPYLKVGSYDTYLWY
jgi:hypothetical protein